MMKKKQERKDKVNEGGMGRNKKNLKEGQGEKSILLEIYNSICSFLASDFFFYYFINFFVIYDWYHPPQGGWHTTCTTLQDAKRKKIYIFSCILFSFHFFFPLFLFLVNIIHLFSCIYIFIITIFFLLLMSFKFSLSPTFEYLKQHLFR